MADRAASEALEYDRPVELEPMRAMERKVVHTYLSERGDVERQAARATSPTGGWS